VTRIATSQVSPSEAIDNPSEVGIMRAVQGSVVTTPAPGAAGDRSDATRLLSSTMDFRLLLLDHD
jgi:hypothetical protein